jgi:predicted alpha/beta-fold hydrolase
MQQEIDAYAVVPMNGFDDLNHYYVEMGAMGDIPHTAGPEDLLENTNGKILTVSIPLCVLHALDDPLITWRTVASNEGPMHPENLVRSGSGNVMILLTKGGGHVGWPVGNVPFVDKWKWMSDAAMSFAHAVDKAKRARPGK